VPLRIGVIGTGFAGAIHARSAHSLPDAQVTAIAAATPEEAAPIAQELGARVEKEPLALCAANDVDLVVVATPTHLHADYAIAAAKAGKHVFCEKPLARTLEQGRAIVRACDDARVALAVGHVVRYFSDYQIAKRMIDDGTLGRPAIVTLTRGNFAVGSARAWYLDAAKSGGVVLDLMLHDLDTARWWFGEPSRVYARRLATGPSGLDYAIATLRYDDRPIVHVEGSWAEHHGFRYGFEVRGDRGMLVHDSRAASPLTVQSPAHGEPAMMAAPTVSESPYRRQLRDVLGRIRRGDRPLVDGHEGLRSLALGLAVIEAADLGAVVEWRAPS
jgi:predicted dehydrogenase